MPITVKEIVQDSLAANSGLSKNDLIISINGNEINDFLDLQFHTAEEVLEIVFKDTFDTDKKITIHQDWGKNLGIIPHEHRCRTCANKCIFCFVDQMPRNLRETLYIKDDDFSFSFVFGNFITLTNLSDKDIERMIEQRLSPLYISVHTTNPNLHKKMLCYKHDFNIMKKLKYLSDNGIQFHTQIVLIPDWNDSLELERTLKDLTSDDLNTLSIGIVPVGLTKFRDTLTRLKPVGKQQALETLKLASKFPKTYCSDEIFLKADKKIPSEDYYDDYPQLENGIGMIRQLKENWKKNKKKFISDIKAFNEKIVLITAELAFKTIKEISDEINCEIPSKSKTLRVLNNAFGRTVTVAGLLTAHDIIDQVRINKDEVVALSNNMFNKDGFTIDNLSKADLIRQFGKFIIIIDEEFASWEFVR